MHGALEQQGKAVVEAHPFVLSYLASDCSLQTILSGIERPMAVMTVNAHADVLFDLSAALPAGGAGLASGEASQTAWKAPGKDPVPIEKPQAVGRSHWAPVLADDGSAIAWIESTYEAASPPVQHIRVRDLVAGNERSIPLPSTGFSGFELLGAATGEQDFVLSTRTDDVLAVDASGTVTWGPKRVTGVDGVDHDFRRVGDGWVAWDLVRTDGKACALDWSTPQGSGHREFPLAGVYSASVSPDGRLIAIGISAGSRLNDQVYAAILRVSDGAQLWRREMPRFTRPQVAFLGDSHLAITAGEGGVEVLRIPRSLVGGSAVAEPPPLDPAAKMVAYIEKLAAQVGLTLETPTAEDVRALAGTWRTAGLAPGMEGCASPEPMYEFRDDGAAYFANSRTRIGTVVLRGRYLQVEGEGEMPPGLTIWRMSGGYYLPSHECMLVKLERVP